MNTPIKLYTLPYTSYRTYLLASLFVVGNLLLPQIVHFIPQGGLLFLPIYFFTLVAAYKYGIYAGLCTALLSPIANHLIFGMPPEGMLPIILMKSVLLAVAAAYASKYFKTVSILALLIVVVAYQLAGTLIESVVLTDFRTALAGVKMGLPGMLLQVFGGFLVLKALSKL